MASKSAFKAGAALKGRAPIPARFAQGAGAAGCKPDHLEGAIKGARKIVLAPDLGPPRLPGLAERSAVGRII